MSVRQTAADPRRDQRGDQALPAVVPSGFQEPIREALPAAVSRLVAAAAPRRVILFGSYAWGTATPASDVDLLVVLDEALPFAERYRLVGGALVPRAFPLDLIVLSQAELDQQVRAGSHFYRDILARGRTLYERPT
jgi:predicted nucleotidyltransferase